MARKSSASLKTGVAAQVAARVNAQMGSDLVVVGNDERFQIQKVSTGSLALDRMLLGGFSRGRHVEIFGDWQVGKSLIVYMCLIEAQRRGEICAIVDGEGVFDEAWFVALGGDAKALIKYKPTTAQQLAKVLQLFVYKDEEVAAVDVVAVDSVASMLPKEELELDYEQDSVQPARLAALMSMLLRNVTSQNDKTLFLWTNQWRDKISRIPGQQSTPGGRALGFYASTRVELKRTEAETQERDGVHKAAWTRRKVKVGQWVQVTLKKDKTGATPEDTLALLLDYGPKRFDHARQIIDLGMKDGLIVRSGDSFEVVVEGHETKKLRGVKAMAAKLNEDDELREVLESLIEARTELLAEGSDGDD